MALTLNKQTKSTPTLTLPDWVIGDLATSTRETERRKALRKSEREGA